MKGKILLGLIGLVVIGLFVSSYLEFIGLQNPHKILKYLNSHIYVMNITLAIPDDIYKKMKKYKEIKWSEVVRRAIIDYIKKLEEGGFETTTKEILEEMDEGFKKSLEELSFENAVEGYEKMRDAEWRRTYTTQTN